MFRAKHKEMPAFCTVTIAALAVVGAVSLAMVAKKKMGSMKTEMKKFGCKATHAMEDMMDSMCGTDGCSIEADE